jgi:hypothetical protein
MECFVVSTTSALIRGSSFSSDAIAETMTGRQEHEPVGNHHLSYCTNQVERKARRERLFIEHEALEDDPGGCAGKRDNDLTADLRKMLARPASASTARWSSRADANLEANGFLRHPGKRER